jgi:hypothetical protein
MRDARFQGGRVSDSEKFVVVRRPLGGVLKAHRQECLCHENRAESGFAEVGYSVEWRTCGFFVFNKMRAIPFV